MSNKNKKPTTTTSSAKITKQKKEIVKLETVQ